MEIGEAVHALKDGKRVARSGWNGKNMFLFLVHGGEVMLGGAITDALPYVAMRTADAKVVPWLCSQTDLLAEDWVQLP